MRNFSDPSKKKIKKGWNTQFVELPQWVTGITVIKNKNKMTYFVSCYQFCVTNFTSDIHLGMSFWGTEELTTKMLIISSPVSLNIKFTMDFITALWKIPLLPFTAYKTVSFHYDRKVVYFDSFSQTEKCLPYHAFALLMVDCGLGSLVSW